MLSYILVFLQFFIIFLMTLPLGNPSDSLIVASIASGIGVLVGVSALNANKLGNFNIRPVLKEDCRLITDGVYRYIRHPMYTSVLLMLLGVVLLYPTKYEIVLFVALFVTLLSKLLYEEHLWKCESEAYKEYTKKTKRLIPFIF